MKIVLPGGTGQIGTMLAEAWRKRGHEVIVIGRRPASPDGQLLPWDGRTLGPWADAIDGADVVVNLAGRSVNCRYNAANRRLILESRLDSTRVLGEALARAANPPPVWLQAATATIYAHRYDAPNDEATGWPGSKEVGAPETWGFSMRVAEAWERALENAPTPRTRKVALRIAMVMTPQAGGVFDVLSGLVRRGLGGRAGNGRQYVSWIHGDDFIRALDAIIANPSLSGPVNVCAPQPLPNAAFMRALRRAWGVRLGLPASGWMLETGAYFLRTETELILKSRRVVPGRLLESGFPFNFPSWPEAAADLVRRQRAGHPAGSRRSAA